MRKKARLMKPSGKRIAFLAIAVAASAILFTAYVTGPPLASTNAPGESSCYASPACHAGTANSGPGFGEITIMGGIPQDNLYVPGSTYVMMPYVVDTAMQKSGFQIVARLLSNGNNAGTSTVTDPTKTQMISGGGYDYVEQTQTGAHKPVMANLHDWMYDWTAPLAGSGTVVFYVAFNAANGDGGPSGDNIYTDTLTLFEDTTSGIENSMLPSENFQLFPNPVKDELHIRWYHPIENDLTISVYDAAANTVAQRTEVPSGATECRIDFRSLSKGMYFLHFGHSRPVSLIKVLKE